MEHTLVRVVEEKQNIKVFEHTFAIDLITRDGGVMARAPGTPKKESSINLGKANNSGNRGCGQVYRETTNPDVATGDGLAMAYRAGATFQDMEFVQFHPHNTLYR